MGTSKRVLLASLVSVVLALAFVIGLAPTSMLPSSAGGSDGRVDMVKLLDLMIGDKDIAQGTLRSPVDGVLVKTPDDNSSTPAIPVPVQLDTGGQSIGTITFVANSLYDPNWTDCQCSIWRGDVPPSPATDFPYVSAIDVSSLIDQTAVNTETAVSVYALLNATAAATKVSALQYEAISSAAEALHLTIQKVTGSVDSDKNGLPDDVFANITPGQIWVANQVVNGVTRRLLIANADGGSAKAIGTIQLQPSANVNIEAPNLEALQADGLVGAGESALVVVETVDSLDGVVDDAAGDTGAVSDWAAAALAKQKGDLTTGGEYIQIAILRTNGSAVEEIEDLSQGSTGTLAVVLTVTGLTPGANAPALYHFPTTATETGGSVHVSGNAVGADDWSAVDGATFVGGNMSASIQQFSVFAPQNSGLTINSVTPTTLPQNYTAPVTITGIFPTAAALNIYEASQAYAVYVNGVYAPFRDGTLAKAETAVTAYDGTNPNQMFVTASGGATAGANLDIEVHDLGQPGNDAILAGAFDVLATGTLAVSATGSVAGVTFAKNPTNGPGLPAGAFFAGANVAVTATLDPSESVGGWVLNGNDLGTTANPVTVPISEGNNALVLSVSTVGFVLNATAGTGGSVGVSPAQPNGGYTPGTIVTLTATPDAGFNFGNWTGADAGDLSPDANTAVVTITMDADKTVQANFTPIQVAEHTVVTSVSGIGGTAAVTTAPNGSGPNLYLDGTVVTITATPDAGFSFDHWTVTGAAPVDPASASTTLTVNGANVLATASFTPILTTSVTSITPNVAYLFGGIVATVGGTGLTDGTAVTIGGNTVTAFRAAADGTTADVLIPASDDASSQPAVVVDVTVTNGNGTSTLSDGFTYNRYVTDANGVNYTAFIVDNNAVGQTVDVTLGAPHTDFGQLILPPLNTTDPVFGLARDSQGSPDKANTPGLQALGTAVIGEGTRPDGVFDFSLHLYTAVQEAKNTPPAGSAVFNLTSGAALGDFGRPVDAQGNPVASTPIKLTFPINGAISNTGLTNADVDKGLTMWGAQSSFDYATNTLFQPTPAIVGYESQILHTEVDPAITATSDPAAEPNLVNEARIYGLNGFSLRTGAVIPAEVAAGVRLDTPSGTANDNTASGPTNGGTNLRIISPGGGLAYVDHVAFVASNGSKQLGGTVTSFATAPGTNEYELALQAPASSSDGVCDIVIYMKASPAVAAVTLPRAYEYVGAAQPLGGLLLLLLGILIAIIGLAAGGHSGGGGGGPCFIATAAYGTPMAAEINTLRDVRDEYLLSNAAGTVFTDTYYRVSPALADYVAKSPVLAGIVRVLLVPVIFLSKALLAMPLLTVGMGLSLGMYFMLRARKARKA